MIHRLLHPTKAYLLAGLIVTGALGGCQALDEMEAEGFRKECENLGMPPGSAHFEQCMLQQQSISENETERAVDRAEREEQSRHRK